jgi:hypothetical protein
MVTWIKGARPDADTLHVAAIFGELRRGLLHHIEDFKVGGSALQAFAQGLADLKTDIAILLLNLRTLSFEILIVEVKVGKVVGLMQYSQLIGYCLVSGARAGILVNVDDGASEMLKQKLVRDPSLSTIERVLPAATINHKFGVMYWRSETQRMEYSDLGAIRNLDSIFTELGI